MVGFMILKVVFKLLIMVLFPVCAVLMEATCACSLALTGIEAKG